MFIFSYKERETINKTSRKFYSTESMLLQRPVCTEMERSLSIGENKSSLSFSSPGTYFIWSSLFKVHGNWPAVGDCQISPTVLPLFSPWLSLCRQLVNRFPKRRIMYRTIKRAKCNNQRVQSYQTRNDI